MTTTPAPAPAPFTSTSTFSALLAWSRENGATPEFHLRTVTRTGEGEYLSSDERGVRGSAWHECQIVAMAPEDHAGGAASRVLAVLPGPQGNEDLVVEDTACRRFLEPLYEGLTGYPLPPPGAEGSERYYAGGEHTYKKTGEKVRWELWRVDDANGYYWEVRWNYPGGISPEETFRRRVVQGLFRRSEKRPGCWYLPHRGGAFVVLSAEEAEETFADMAEWRV